MLNKKAKISLSVALIWVSLIVVGGLVVLSFIPQQSVVTKETKEAGIIADQSVSCPTNFAWTGTVTVQNTANTTGAQTFDTTMNFYEISADGSEDTLSFDSYNKFAKQITDTTAGSVSLDCGKRYAVKILSVNGAGGDQSRIRSIVGNPSGVKDTKVNDNGVLTFTATGSQGSFTAGSHQKGNFETRVKDIVNDGFVSFVGGNTTGIWNSTDGVNWTSTVQTEKGIAVGVGGEYHIILYMRSTNADRNANDYGTYVLAEATTSTFNTPVAKIDGVTAADIKDSGLNPDEVKAYSAYEYVYLIPKTKNMLSNNEVAFDYQIFASGGQNPNGNPLDLDLATIGSYTSVTDANLLKIGAVDDSSSRADVYTRFDNTLAVE